MKKLFILTCFVCGLMSVQAQNYTLFYNFDNVNQNLLVNPSNPHDFRLVLGFPALNSSSVHIRNGLFKTGDVLQQNVSSEDVDRIIAGLSGNERINLYESNNLLFAGFGIKSGYISFGIQQEASLRSVMPAEFIKFLYYGNSQYDDVNFQTNNFDFESQVNVNYHVGYQHWLMDSNLIVGGRFKFISGAGHEHFKRFDAKIESDFFEWNIETDILLETSGFAYLENYSDYGPTDFIVSGNNGWGLDLGATYLWEDFKFSASVLGIGSINWTRDNAIYQSKGTYTWDGATIDMDDQEFDFDEVLDSLESKLGFKEISPYNYKSKLPLHILASAEYSLTQRNAFAITYQGRSWNGSINNTFGVNYIGRYFKRLNLLLGYSYTQGGFHNVGAGLSAALGPLQIYAMSTNAWGLADIKNMQATSVRFGLNLVFYDKHLKRKKKQEKETQEKQSKS